MYNHIAIVGGNGAIGSALIDILAERYPDSIISVFSRRSKWDATSRFQQYEINYHDEGDLEEKISTAAAKDPFDLVIIATGILHEGQNIQPEKSLKDLSAEKFMTLFTANAVFPALAAKHFLPRMNKEKRAVFAALSARVGSISDNQLGGWYAYRSSKCALNMIIRNAAIEMGRRYKDMIIVTLHPGTVDSHLSKPFQGNVKEGKLFTAAYSAQEMLSVLNNLTPASSGKCYAWNGKEILP